MSDPARLSRFLSQRLARMGVEVRYFEGESSALGELRLREQAFPTLGEPLLASSAHFYTLGHNRLKFWSPGAFFDLPALDVGGCESADQIENALRQSWAARMRDLVEARAWLERLGTCGRAAARDTCLLLPVGLERTPPAYVRSTSEILVPSGGPLANVSLAEPAQRRYRPLRSLEHACELELGLTSQVARLAHKQAGVAAAAGAKPDRSLAPLPRVLVVDDAPDALDALQMALLAAGFEVDGFRDPALALNAFQLRSYGAVVAEARLRQGGLRFAARLQELAGIEKLPVLLFDKRPDGDTRRAAEDAGAAAYIQRPRLWAQVGETLADLVDASHRRAFVRYPASLEVEGIGGGATVLELTDCVGRGGLSLRTSRVLAPGCIERYRIRLPDPLPPIAVDTAVVCGTRAQGDQGTVAGVRFLRFLGGAEPRWIRFIETLAASARRNDQR